MRSILTSVCYWVGGAIVLASLTLVPSYSFVAILTRVLIHLSFCPPARACSQSATVWCGKAYDDRTVQAWTGEDARQCARMRVSGLGSAAQYQHAEVSRG